MLEKKRAINWYWLNPAQVELAYAHMRSKLTLEDTIRKLDPLEKVRMHAMNPLSYSQAHPDAYEEANVFLSKEAYQGLKNALKLREDEEITMEMNGQNNVWETIQRARLNM